MNIKNQRKSLTAIALISVYITGLQLISNTITASAATPNLANKAMLAANNGICSFITGNNVNVRSSPGTKYKVVTRLNRADVVRAVRRSGNWVQLSGKITSRPGITPEVVKPLKGWVLNAYINGCSEDQFDRWRG